MRFVLWLVLQSLPQIASLEMLFPTEIAGIPISWIYGGPNERLDVFS